jgi:hypothetical protein
MSSGLSADHCEHGFYRGQGSNTCNNHVKSVSQLHEECNDLFQRIAVQEAVLKSLNNQFVLKHKEYCKVLEAQSEQNQQVSVSP